MNVLSISVHPDDETLGCGGALLRHLADGDCIHWGLVTAAAESDYDAKQIDRQRRQVEAVNAAYPFHGLHWMKLPTTRLESMPLNQVVDALRGVMEAVRPDIVYIPHRGDVHSDHRVVHDAAMAVTKAFYMRTYGVRKVLACEVLSETDAAYPAPATAFMPNVLLDVSSVLERKLEIFNLFESEIHSGFLPRNAAALRALARVRGAAIGVEYAEAFMLMREVVV